MSIHHAVTVRIIAVLGLCIGYLFSSNNLLAQDFQIESPENLGLSTIRLEQVDNLIKGASGQAVQNMNVAFKLKETLGLQ